MKILAFAATNHKSSINKKLVSYTTVILKDNVIPDAEIEIIDLIDYELPLYRQDREEDHGIPEQVHDFYNKIGEADALIISFAEHNGSYTAVYKNLFDWASRIDQKVYQDKPTMIMSASPGGKGGAGVLKTAESTEPFFGMDLKATVSVPVFQDNFNFESGKVINPDIQVQIQQALNKLKQKG